MENEYQGNVISLKKYKNEKLLGELRKYPDVYEYCIIPGYEDKFIETHTECIQMDECFANIIKNGDNYVLISIIFGEEWTVQEITEWLTTNEITLHRPTSSPFEIKNAKSIVEAKKFRDYPIILSERGIDSISLDPSDLDEVTEGYEKFNKISNTGLANPVDFANELLDKDDCLDREYPGVSDEDGPVFTDLFTGLMSNIQYSDVLRGLFIYCQTCNFEGVVVHDKRHEIEEPYCSHCGSKISLNNCEWVNGPL